MTGPDRIRLRAEVCALLASCDDLYVFPYGDPGWWPLHHPGPFHACVEAAREVIELARVRCLLLDQPADRLFASRAATILDEIDQFAAALQSGPASAVQSARNQDGILAFLRTEPDPTGAYRQWIRGDVLPTGLTDAEGAQTQHAFDILSGGSRRWHLMGFFSAEDFRRSVHPDLASLAATADRTCLHALRLLLQEGYFDLDPEAERSDRVQLGLLEDALIEGGLVRQEGLRLKLKDTDAHALVKRVLATALVARMPTSPEPD